MLDPSVYRSRESNLNPLTGHEARTSEREHMGMFWQSRGLVPDEKTEAHMEGSLYSTQISFPLWQDSLSKATKNKYIRSQGCHPTPLSWRNTRELPVVIRDSGISGLREKTGRGVGGKKQICHVQSMRWPNIVNRTGEAVGLWKVRLSECAIQKMMWDNKEVDGGAYGAEADVRKNMWKTFTGLAGHDLWVQGDSQGSEVTLSRPHMMNGLWTKADKVLVWLCVPEGTHDCLL